MKDIDILKEEIDILFLD